MLDLYAILAAIGAIIAAVLAAWGFGRFGTKAKQELKSAKDYAATRKAMDDESHTDDDPAVLRDWMRERGKR